MEKYARLEPFDPNEDDWDEYAERLEMAFAVNGVDDSDAATKRAVLLTICGKKAFSLLKSLCAPQKPSEKTFDVLCGLLKSHCDPKPSTILERFRFHSRRREAGESVVEYVAALRKIASKCDFGGELDNNLRDQLVIGVGNSTMQRKMLLDNQLTLESAAKIASSEEVTERHVQELHSVVGASAGCDDATAGAVRERQTVFRAGKDDSRAGGKTVTKASAGRRRCYRCGSEEHMADGCRHKTTTCHKCGKSGHLARACRQQQQERGYQRRTTPAVRQCPEHSDEEDGIYEEMSSSLHFLQAACHKTGNVCNADPPLAVEVEVNGSPLNMEVDTGAAVSIISSNMLEERWPDLLAKVQPCPTKLTNYSGASIPVVGQVEVQVRVSACTTPQATFRLPLVVIQGAGETLLGRNWLSKIRLNWAEIFSVSGWNKSGEIGEILSRHEEVFEDGLGRYTGPEVNIRVTRDATPKFCKARPVPYAQKEAVERELLRLESEGIIEPVSQSEWASPVVTVTKPDGSIRLCGDYKRTLNPSCVVDQYPLPHLEDVFAQFAGCTRFSKIDLSQAYLQLVLAEESRKYTTINTVRGLFQFRRMPFGVASASAIFQRTIESVVRGIPHTVVRADDILVSGTTDDEHLANVEEVLVRLERAGLRAKRRKCKFFEPEVVYMGYLVDKDGHRPDPEKTRSLLEAPAPTNVSQLRSYLGMLNYYNNFLSQTATVLEPLHRLLRKGAKWEWGPDQHQAFRQTKSRLCSAPVLMHYDPGLPVQVSCDASPFGVGAVLSHVGFGGVEHPVAYASRTLSQAERNYAQFEREALAVVFAVKRFHKYLYGRTFSIVTDHKPLIGVFGPDRPIPNMASSRMIRWCLMLQAYKYSIRHRSGDRNQNADALSRLPYGDAPSETPLPGEVIHLLGVMDRTPVTSADIATSTARDPVLRRVKHHLLVGWPKIIGEPLRSFYQKKDELSVSQGCLLRGTRVVIPCGLRHEVLQDLHQGHPGIVRMKALARSYVWWPQMDHDIELHVKRCEPCQMSRPSEPHAPLQVWDWPRNPWQRLHADYGTVEGKNVLVVIDAHSKWIEAVVTRSQTAQATIDAMRAMFATHGVPQACATDNGPCFVSQEFHEFMEANGVELFHSTPYHPATNGLAEKAVQTVKLGVARQGKGGLDERLAAFLLAYRVTPQSTTHTAPCELLMGRRLATRLNRMFPDPFTTVKEEQHRQVTVHNKHARDRKFYSGDRVFVKNFSKSMPSAWLPAVVTAVNGPVSYTCFSSLGERRFHVEQMRSRVAEIDPSEGPFVDQEPHQDALLENCSPANIPDADCDERETTAIAHGTPAKVEPADKTLSTPETHVSTQLSDHGQSEKPLRRSTRARKPPERLDL